MFMSQYEEHLAHSAPCSSRWDGFDRGDSGLDDEFAEEICREMDEYAASGAAIGPQPPFGADLGPLQLSVSDDIAF